MISEIVMLRRGGSGMRMRDKLKAQAREAGTTTRAAGAAG